MFGFVAARSFAVQIALKLDIKIALASLPIEQTLTNALRKPATPPPKAWQGANPITTRANNTPATPNGIDRPSPKATPISSATGMGSQGDKQAHERLVFLLASMTV